MGALWDRNEAVKAKHIRKLRQNVLTKRFTKDLEDLGRYEPEEIPALAESCARISLDVRYFGEVLRIGQELGARFCEQEAWGAFWESQLT